MYDELLVKLRTAIQDGSRKAGEFVGTEQEFCRENGISRVSVRRATDQLIREGLIERRPGKGLFVRQADLATREIGVIVPDLAFEQCVQIARGAQLLGGERGYQVQVYDAHNRMDHDIAILKGLPDRSADGALILSWHHPRFTEALIELKQKGFPFVLVDEHTRDLEVASVTADNHAGGLMVGNALVDLGHRTFGFIGNMAAGTVRARLEGLRDAVGDRGLPFDRSRVVDLAVQPQEDWSERIARCTRQLLSREDRPTAVFYSDDQVAAEAYRTIRGMGLRIPADVSIVGFDDSPLCRWLDPPLASVRQPSVEMGRVAMELLFDGIGRDVTRKRAPTQHVTLPVEWVPRASISAPPATTRPGQ
ncbi:MAG TPA: GntR family transcriptional regulator [Tepidisphaeraceae bacterium]|nr:GntR family transcriptional regulator [Tepidisphaeraceae bacterium]